VEAFVNRAEKAFVVFYFAYLAVYVLYVVLLHLSHYFDQYFFVLVLPFHFFGMAIGIVMYVIVIRDIYKRTFPNPNSKVTWTLLVILLWPSILVYLYKHGFRPRVAFPTV
jgi:branched-subunit amino acid ABC-type transport system permease component